MALKLEEVTKVHTPQFDKFYPLLTGIDIMIGERFSHKTFYNPPDDCAIYQMTNYMTDAELEFINSERRNLSTKEGPAVQLPRLAYTTKGWVKCYNQRERLQIEKREFTGRENDTIQAIERLAKQGIKHA